MTAKIVNSRYPILSSLGEFLLAGLRPRTPLAKTIVFMLIVKLMVILSMRLFWFSDDARLKIDAAMIGQHLGAAVDRP